LAIKTNYALRADMNEAEFIQEVTDGLLPPAYFGMNAMNKKGMKTSQLLMRAFV
jgi:hypothetical protein